MNPTVKAALKGLGLHHVRRRVVQWRIGKRHPQACATHIPVLVGLPRVLKIRRVLELGCGLHSTQLFLDRSVYPDLEAIDSYETDPEWFERVDELTRNDSRITLTCTAASMRTAVREIDLSPYDLVFVDDSTCEEDRTETIQEVAHRCGPGNLVAIHDYEQRSYREAATAIPRHFRFTALNPNTGLAWSELGLPKRRLVKLNRLIRRCAPETAPTDVSSWVRIMNDSPC